MAIQDVMDTVCAPVFNLSEYILTFKKPQMELKEKVVPVEVKPEPTAGDILLGKLWDTAEKAGGVVLGVAMHSATQQAFKGVINQAVARAESGAMKKAAHLVGDMVLPGNVAAIEIAIMLITGFGALAKQ